MLQRLVITDYRAVRHRRAEDLRAQLETLRSSADELPTVEVVTCSPLIDNDGIEYYFNAPSVPVAHRNLRRSCEDRN